VIDVGVRINYGFPGSVLVVRSSAARAVSDDIRGS
jgi:hypothetical protein